MSAPSCAAVHHNYPRTPYAIAKRQAWHGSNQPTSSNSIKGCLLLLTHLSLLGELMLVAGALLRPQIGLVGLVVTAAVVAVLSTDRVWRHGTGRGSCLGSFQVFLVTAAYFIGRYNDLSKNYWKVLKRRLGRHA